MGSDPSKGAWGTWACDLKCFKEGDCDPLSCILNSEFVKVAAWVGTQPQPHHWWIFGVGGRADPTGFPLEVQKALYFATFGRSIHQADLCPCSQDPPDPECPTWKEDQG